MMKSSDINSQLEKCQFDLSQYVDSLTEQEERANQHENNFHAELSRAGTLARELSECQNKMEAAERQHNLDNRERSEEAKKGAYIINVLTSELKLAKARATEVESININLENYNETLKTLLRTSKSCNCNVSGTQSMPSSPPSIGRYGVHTNNYQTSTWTAGATSATNSSLAVDNQYVHKLITELSVLQRGEAQWRDERTALLTEIDAQNSQVQLLVKLSADLCALKNDTNTP